jgi:CheY-like chemotaxis protein/HPt (histidine-containing phosphotransfer) domain-containing protein
VKTSADSLLTIINDILDFSKIEAGKLDLDAIDFDLRDSLGDMMKALALRAHQKGLELACHILPEVPAAVVGDPGRLRQIIVNLVGNAIKFTERGEVVVEVKRGAKSEERGAKSEERGAKSEEREAKSTALDASRSSLIELHFSVRDTGIGIPAEKQRLIFEAFSQADGSTTRKYGGTGLGLTISSRLVEMMGGRIWVESPAFPSDSLRNGGSQGSAFHFTARFGLQRNPAVQPIPVEPVNLRDLPVLVVDDNATNRRILEEMLFNWQMKPAVVDSGRAALVEMRRAVADDAPYSLVLLDAMMPEMDGFALAEQIKHNPELAGATIMMLSSVATWPCAIDRQMDASRCLELGIAVYLMKPIKQSELLGAIVTALGAWRADFRLARPAARQPETCGERSQTIRNPKLVVSAVEPSAIQQGLRILLAEDNAVNRKLAVRLLEKRGHTVVVAGNGKEALAALEKEQFDLALMDVQMPEMDGFEATAAIRKKEKAAGAHLPIIAMTAHAMKGDQERCLEAGMDGYVAKPLRVAELFAAIESLSPTLTLTPTPRNIDTPVRHAQRMDEGPTGQVINASEVLARVDGDMDFLAELVDLFLDSSPKLLSDIRETVSRGDPEALARAAHTLKGSVGNFAPNGGAFKAALRLEMIGREGDMTGVEDTCVALEAEIKYLESALIALRKDTLVRS